VLGSVPMLEPGTLPNLGSAQLPRIGSGQHSRPSSVSTKRASEVKRHIYMAEENGGRNEGSPTGWQHVVRKGGADWATVITGKNGTRGKKRCHEEHGNLAG
jgi:hypothetical protein